jgi:hypothetical protein
LLGLLPLDGDVLDGDVVHWDGQCLVEPLEDGIEEGIDVVARLCADEEELGVAVSGKRLDALDDLRRRRDEVGLVPDDIDDRVGGVALDVDDPTVVSLGIFSCGSRVASPISCFAVIHRGYHHDSRVKIA